MECITPLRDQSPGLRTLFDVSLRFRKECLDQEKEGLIREIEQLERTREELTAREEEAIRRVQEIIRQKALLRRDLTS